MMRRHLAGLAVLLLASVACTEDAGPPIQNPSTLDAPAETAPAAVVSALAEHPLPEHDGDRTLSPYFFLPGADDGTERLPLKETTARIAVAGPIARAEVRQVYENTGSTPIEAVYVFPASTRAAVHALRMTIGARTIEARIEEREAARESYEQAREEGRRAALLEQERPNVFAMNVANIMPGDRIEITLQYSELLVPESGIYELVYPAVVGPRYGGGADPATDGWIESPHLHQGEPEPYRFGLSVRLDAGLPLQAVASPSHRIDAEYPTATSAEVGLAESGGGDRDFVLRWRLAGNAVEAGLLRYEDPGSDESYFLVQIEPPARPAVADVPRRDYVFVVDVSGSMAGFPLDTSKALMRRLLGALRPTDTFNVVLFAGGAGMMNRAGSLPATPANVEMATGFIDNLQGGGGTELMEGLRVAYGAPRSDDGISRSIVLLSDGFVAVESEAFRFVRERLGQANFFALGIGGSVNRALMEGLARAGHGEPFVVLSPEAADGEAERFRRYVQTPVLTDVEVRFDGLHVSEVVPEGVPDVMAERPIVLFGRYRRGDAGAIELSGRTGQGRWSRRIELGSSPARLEHAPIRELFGRKWVEILTDQMQSGDQAPDLQDRITSLGIRFHLLTQFTSFVAVDSVVANDGAPGATVRQPLPLPAGVTDMAVGGYGSGSIGALGMLGTGRGGSLGESWNSPTSPYGPTKVRPGTADVQGSLDREVIRRVIRRHINEIRFCYEQGGATREGVVSVRFVIGPTGAVTIAAVARSTLGDAPTEACIVTAVRRWTFPAPSGGGSVTVTYPFRLIVATEPRRRGSR